MYLTSGYPYKMNLPFLQIPLNKLKIIHKVSKTWSKALHCETRNSILPDWLSLMNRNRIEIND